MLKPRIATVLRLTAVIALFVLLKLVFFSLTSEHRQTHSVTTRRQRREDKLSIPVVATVKGSINAGATPSTSVPNAGVTSPPTSAMPICTSRERLDYIRRQIPRRTKMPRVGKEKKLKLIADDKHRLAYCEIAKCASSTLTKFMVVLGGKYTVSELKDKKLWLPQVQKRFGLRLVNESSLYTISGYRKFVVIRHPLDRFVSAFNDKILTPTNYDIPFRARFLKFLKGKHRKLTQFQRFTKAVLSGHNNFHWDPHADTCRFDKVDYDDVIRMESFRHDLEPMVNDYLKLNWSHVVDTSYNVKRMNASAAVPRTVTSRRLSIFEQIPKNEVLQLKDMYRDDFELLGYDFDVDSLTMSCKIETSDGRICC